MPTDPDALYALVLKSQGLNFPGVKPWHIKASYTVFDAKGENPVNGVFEEWFVGPHKYKLSYTRPGFNQTDYGTGAGLYRVGEQKWTSGEELWIPISLMQPMPDVRGDKIFTLLAAEFTGSVKLRCLQLADSAHPIPHPGASNPTFCIDPASPVVRLGIPYGPGRETIYNHILGFQGHSVPGEILINIRGKTTFKLTVDSLDSLQGANDALLSPPSDAVLIPPGPVKISSGSTQGLRTVSAVFPALAEKDHFEGIVFIQATIDRNGHVTNPKILRGPRIYQQSALNAASQWVFRPFLLGGEPAEVDTQVGVAFNVGP